jgi:succinoglycan biosynthesis transport protein ExoP
VLNRFKEATTVKRSGRSYIANVSFTSSNPQKAAAAANALAAAYVGYRSSIQSRGVEETGSRLEGHIARLREKSEAASAAVDKLQGKARNRAQANGQLRTLESQSQTYQSIYKALLVRYAKSVHEQASPLTEARIISEAPLGRSVNA